MTVQIDPNLTLEPKAAKPLPNKTYVMSRRPDGTAVAMVCDYVAHFYRQLPHVVRHSPDGFEWGYMGSGPADLALSILADHLGETPSESEINSGRFRAWGLHQDFKSQIVGGMPRAEAWTITSQAIDEWLKTNDPYYGKTWRQVDREMWASMDEVRPLDDPAELPEGTLGEKTELVYVTVCNNDTFAIVSRFDAVYGQLPANCALYTIVFEAPAFNGAKGRISIYRYFQEDRHFNPDHLRLVIVVAANLFPRWRNLERLDSTLRNIIVGSHSVNEALDEDGL